MSQVRSVLIVGAGIGGLGAGTALAQRGIQVDVVEIKPEPNVYGVGINQPGNSLRALRTLGVLDEIRELGFEFDRWTFHDAKGELVVSVPSNLGHDGVPPNVALARRDLHQVLIGAADRAGVNVRYGTSVKDFDEDTGHVELSDGSTGDYDVIIGFDGINSPLRARLFPTRRNRPTPASPCGA